MSVPVPYPHVMVYFFLYLYKILFAIIFYLWLSAPPYAEDHLSVPLFFLLLTKLHVCVCVFVPIENNKREPLVQKLHKVYHIASGGMANHPDVRHWKSHLLTVQVFCCAVWAMFTFLEVCEAVHLVGEEADVTHEVRHPVVVIGLLNFIQAAALAMLLIHYLVPKFFLEVLFMILNAVWILSMAVILCMIYMDTLHPNAGDDQEFMRFPFHMIASAVYLNVACVLQVLFLVPHIRYPKREKDPLPVPSSKPSKVEEKKNQEEV